MRAIRSITKICHRLASLLNGLGVSFLALVMLLIVLNIVMRFVQKPMPGAVELVEYMQVVLVFLAIAHTQVHRGHVAIDMIVERFPRRAQDIIDSITNFVSLCFFGLMTWQIVLQAGKIQAAGQQSTTLHIPVFPFLWVAAVGSASLCLIFVVDLLYPLTQRGKSQ